MSYMKEFTKGLIKENPNLVMLLGMCPTLAVTTMAENGLGMGLATTFVLVCSNLVISLLKKVIPGTVRLPCFIVVIAGFVTFVSIMLDAFLPSLSQALGVFLSLITVNCIILGRAEMFAGKNKVLPSILDGAGMGIGFTLALVLMATFREVLGNGTWLGIEIPVLSDNPIAIMTMAPGGFLVFGILMAVVAKLTGGKSSKKSFGCAGCPSAKVCGKTDCEQKEGAK